MGIIVSKSCPNIPPLDHGKDPKKLTYGIENETDEVGESVVDIVDDEAHLVLLAGADVARHVLLQHGLDVTAGLGVALEDGLGPEEPALLG